MCDKKFLEKYRYFLILAVAIAYLITARLGLLLALHPGFATAYWPPSGIAVATLLLFDLPIWPGILLGSFFANLLTVEDFSTALMVSAGISIGSTLQPLAIAYLLKTATTSMPHLLNTRKNILSFLIFTLLCCAISPTISLATLYGAEIITRETFGINWVTWWLGDTVGIYVFAPFLFSWAKRPDFDEISRKGFELFQLVGLTLALSLLCFGGWLSKGYPIEYSLMPCLIWAAFRFPTQITTSLLVLISIISVIGTARGYGPFIQPSRNESLLLLQAFIGIITATTLIIISSINEIWHAQEVLEEYSKELKDQVKFLQESKK